MLPRTQWQNVILCCLLNNDVFLSSLLAPVLDGRHHLIWRYIYENFIWISCWHTWLSTDRQFKIVSEYIYIYICMYMAKVQKKTFEIAREDGNRKINVLHIRSIQSANANGKTPRLRAESIKTATAKHSKWAENKRVLQTLCCVIGTFYDSQMAQMANGVCICRVAHHHQR